MGAQDLLNSFYSIDNLVSFEITMDPDKWNELLTAEPVNIGQRLPDGSYDMPLPPGKHYEWTTATSVTISGTKFPKKSIQFTNVGIIKKAWYGSKSFTKPAFKLDFSRFNAANEDLAKSLVGTDYFVLNNSKQDPAYVRQPLGYELFRQAGVPSFRCNFATVKVNGKFWGGDDHDGTHLPQDGVYVNLEFVKKKFLKNCFNNDQGNAYELEYLDDFDPERLSKGYLSFQGFSVYRDRTDLLRAAQEIKDRGLSGAKKVVDWDAYTRFYAMEALTWNYDGYNHNQNNTYIYNDEEAKADPQVEKNDINFKFIPCGIDQCLRSDRGMVTADKSVLSLLTVADKDAKAQLYDQIRKYADDIFGAKNIADVIHPYIDKELDVLKSAGASFNQADIDAVKQLIDNMNSWAYSKVGAPN